MRSSPRGGLCDAVLFKTGKKHHVHDTSSNMPFLAAYGPRRDEHGNLTPALPMQEENMLTRMEGDDFGEGSILCAGDE